MNTVTLANCDQEPIHIPAAIQPHGVALACTPGTLVVEQVSANLGDVTGVRPEAALGVPVDALFVAESAALLRAAAADSTPRVRGSVVVQTVGGETFDAVLHRSGDAVVIELEPHTLDLVGYHPILRETIARFQTTRGVLDLCKLTASEVRHLTGFDRVMVYRFDALYNGEVIAEAKRDDLESFLGHHYPASDIPSQARRLYTVNTLRLIADASYLPSPLLPPLRPSGEPLDLSHSVLRSVSPIHCQYLANMGVRASMSISLLRDGELWGIIACHHYAGPKTVPFVLRDSAELIGQTLSWIVATRERAVEAERERDSQRVESEIVRTMSGSANFVDGLAVPALLRVTNADGAAVIFENDIRLFGSTPGEEAVRDLADWIRDQRFAGETFVTDDLASHRPDPSAATRDVASGILAVAIAQDQREFVIWFRVSTERVIPWAGHPAKEIDPNAPRLSPRGSFALWVETVRGKSLPWQPWEIAAASNLRRVLLGGVRRRAAELRTLADKLVLADALKDSFLASVSHELRTPLNAIVGWARILRTRQTPEKYTHALDVIERNAHAQTQLVEDLLDVSRMTTGKLSLEVQPFDLAPVIASALESVALSAEARGIRLRRVVDARGSVIVGDARRLQQVIWNLTTNAIKFTPKGGHVEVVLRRDGSDVEIVVQDSGQGMRADLLPHVFESFRQGDARDGRGLGLGLAIARHIVELHGGSITASSPGEGLGSTLRVRLPVSSMDVASAATPEEDVAPDNRLAGLRILVVEDERDSRDLLVAMLSERGAVVLPYETATLALSGIQGDRPDIVLSDIGLPGMDGHAFLRELRALPPDAGGTVPAVALTALARPRDRTLALTSGFQSYISKPLDVDELVAVIHSLLVPTATGRLTPTGRFTPPGVR